MNEQDVADSMWALATLQLEIPGELSDRMQAAAHGKAHDLTAQQVCNTLWALAYWQACCGRPAEAALVHALLVRTSKLEDSILFNVTHCYQVSVFGFLS